MADHLHICPLCEATCGLRVTIEEGQVTAVRGDEDDVFSGGFICPKGTAIGELHHDPDRLRTPMVRDEATGRLVPASWDDAFELIRSRLAAVVAAHGPDSVALFLGNPNVHNTSSAFYLPAFIRALGTTSRYTASTVDQFPKQVSSALMFGTPLSVAVPDIDRTDYLLILGANPLVSNGSMMTAPDMPGRLRALRKRGGRLVVVDPVRTRTARAADEHVAIRPGGDAFLLASIANVLVEEDLVDPGRAGGHLADGSLAQVAAAVAPFTPEAVAAITGVPAGDHPPPRPGARRRILGGRLRADGHDHVGAGDQRRPHHAPGHRRFVAGRRRQRHDRLAGRARRRDVAAAASRRAQHPGPTRDRPGRDHPGAAPHPRARPAQHPRRVPRGCPGRGDRHTGP